MILQLVIKKARAEPAQFIFVIIAIASVIALVLVLEGFRQGIYQQIRQIIMSRGADVIVAQAGVSNMVASRSILPQLSRQAVERIDGVVEAHPMTSLPAIYDKDGRQTPVFVLVYDTLGGPAELEAGRQLAQNREIVIDRSLAVIYELLPGDDFVLNDFSFTVVGISKDTAAFFTPFAFTNYDDLIDLYFESDIVGDLSTLPLLSFLLVEIEAGRDASRIAAEIDKRVPEVDAYLPDAIAANDVAMSCSMLGQVFQLMIVIAYLIGVLVIGLIMFSSVQKRKYELAVFKAIGFSFSRLAQSVIAESLLLTLLALPLAAVFAYVLSLLIQEAAPVYLILTTEDGPMIRTLIASLVFSILGSLMSFRMIARLEPVLALRR
ncbi:MAG TPA: ABC transporter permease [Gammaproteobacteria bacterium]